MTIYLSLLYKKKRKTTRPMCVNNKENLAKKLVKNNLKRNISLKKKLSYLLNILIYFRGESP